MKKIFTSIVLIVFIAISNFGQTTIIDFEIEGSGYTPSATTGSGFTDVFNRTNTDLAAASNEDGFYWAIEDLPPGFENPFITLDPIDVTGATSFDFSIDMLAHHYNDWDANDELIITYALDGGTEVNLLAVQSVDFSGSNAPAALDTDFDGQGECGATTTLPSLTTGTSSSCTVSSSDFANFSAPTIPLSSNSTLVIKLLFVDFEFSDEGMYLDNITITENMGAIPPSISFAASDYSLDEDGITLEVCADITNSDMSAATTVDVILDGGSTATNGTDYDDGAGTPGAISFPVTLTFPANAMGTDAQQCFDIFISNDDMDIEGDETIVLNLTNPSGMATIGSITTTTVTIVDNDFAPTFDIIINEFMSDPTGNDSNLDGTVSTTQDEFVELYNNEATTIDISNYTLSDAGGVQFTFPASTMIPAGEFFTVFGGGDATNISGITFIASGLSLNNSGDDITIEDASGNEVTSYTYTGSSSDDQSQGRFPDFTGSFMLHSMGNTGVPRTPNASNATMDVSNADCGLATTLANNIPNGLIGESFGITVPYSTSCAGDNPGVWYNVNTDSDGGILLVSVTPTNGADIAIEIFDACSGNSVGCADDSGAGMVENLSISDPGFVGKGGSSSRSDVDYKVLVSLVSAPITTGITFDIAASGTALPVEISKFTATANFNSIVLDWSTSLEINNERFDIQKSTDGKTFETIGSVKGEGNSTRAVDYMYTDVTPKSGVNYYRLKQIDFDGKFDYSEVVSANVKTDKIVVAPSRTQDIFSVFINYDEQANINVYNTNGQLIISKENVRGTQEINISDMIQGTYFVVIAANSQTQVEKVVKL